jgi:hypothetical protein
MFYSLKKFPIDLFIEKDADMVTSVANDLLESTEESNTAKIAGALEDIIKFSFGKKKNSKAIGQELIDLTFDLIKRHRYDFEKMKLYQLKQEVINLTYEWGRRNRLRASLRRNPRIYETCFEFCIYNYAEVLRREKAKL